MISRAGFAVPSGAMLQFKSGRASRRASSIHSD
jgi:hypothetical protein